MGLISAFTGTVSPSSDDWPRSHSFKIGQLAHPETNLKGFHLDFRHPHSENIVYRGEKAKALFEDFDMEIKRSSHGQWPTTNVSPSADPSTPLPLAYLVARSKVSRQEDLPSSGTTSPLSTDY